MGRVPFKKEVIDKVFINTTRPISGQNARQKRKDFKGREIARAAYGNENSNYGWNIHHKDENKNNNKLENLRAVHYETHNEIH